MLTSSPVSCCAPGLDRDLVALQRGGRHVDLVGFQQLADVRGKRADVGVRQVLVERSDVDAVLEDVLEFESDALGVLVLEVEPELRPAHRADDASEDRQPHADAQLARALAGKARRGSVAPDRRQGDPTPRQDHGREVSDAAERTPVPGEQLERRDVGLREADHVVAEAPERLEIWIITTHLERPPAIHWPLVDREVSVYCPHIHSSRVFLSLTKEAHHASSL